MVEEYDEVEKPWEGPEAWTELVAERNYYRKALQDVQHIVANAAMFFSEQAKAEREKSDGR